MADRTPRIADSYDRCLQSFGNVQHILRSPSSWGSQQGETRKLDFLNSTALPMLDQALGRFRVWGHNLGAHRSDKASLDHKLRNVSLIHEVTKNCLNTLEESLQ